MGHGLGTLQDSLIRQADALKRFRRGTEGG